MNPSLSASTLSRLPSSPRRTISPRYVVSSKTRNAESFRPDTVIAREGSSRREPQSTIPSGCVNSNERGTSVRAATRAVLVNQWNSAAVPGQFYDLIRWMREGRSRGSSETRARDIAAALAEMNFARRQMVTACKNGLRRSNGGRQPRGRRRDAARCGATVRRSTSVKFQDTDRRASQFLRIFDSFESVIRLSR